MRLHGPHLGQDKRYKAAGGQKILSSLNPCIFAYHVAKKSIMTYIRAPAFGASESGVVGAM
jgi:hypothetical protein